MSHALPLQRAHVNGRALELFLGPSMRDLRADRHWQPARERDRDAEHVFGDGARTNAPPAGGITTGLARKTET